MRIALNGLQPLGRALMLPIAVLPVAAMLLRLGQADLLDLRFIAAAGEAIFSNLGILFAIGVAVGLARENHGAAGLAGAVAYLVAVEGAKGLMAVPPDASGAFIDQAAIDLSITAWKTKQMAKLSVPCGIAAGLASGWLYNRYSNIRLPEYLAFFGGRRFVPIAAGLAGLIGALIFGLGFPRLAGAIDAMSHWVVQAGGFGLFLYGVLNRLLIVTGLHHILNNLAWFIVGDFNGTTGDLKRFFAGDPTAGQFMSGFFPVMMFGLPAACLAMYRSAPPERRRQVGGMFMSLALTSFLTGVTEPIEFTFMFLAPVLYLVHAVLTGISMTLMDALGVRLGFGFSAGLFDYVLNFRSSTRPLMLLPVGLCYSAIYYAAFRFCIKRFDLLTPGREAEVAAAAKNGVAPGTNAQAFIRALGGRDNLKAVDACTTRLRLQVGEAAVDETALKALGSRGVLRTGHGLLQIVLGPIADQVASDIRQTLADGMPTEGSPAAQSNAQAILDALGGESNIAGWRAKAGRLSVKVTDPRKVHTQTLMGAAPRGAAFVQEDRVHLLVDNDLPSLNACFGRILKPEA